MHKTNLRFFLIGLLLFTFTACNSKSKQEKPQKKSLEEIRDSIHVEGNSLSNIIQEWKNSLVENKTLGTFADFDKIQSKAAKEWSKNNPNQLDGLPNDSLIKVKMEDFNEDGKRDVLLYFQSVNYTGHNGNSPSFAKIIYSNGGTQNQIVNNIKNGIINAYIRKMEENDKLKTITDAYLRNNISIAYNKGIHGSFRLYTPEDAHCCPHYSGDYTYNIKEQDVAISLTTLLSDKATKNLSDTLTKK